jgi:hypothetical protein
LLFNIPTTEKFTRLVNFPRRGAGFIFKQPESFVFEIAESHFAKTEFAHLATDDEKRL